MPVLSWGHGQYWAGVAASPALSAGASARGGYIAWMPHVVIPLVIFFLLYLD